MASVRLHDERDPLTKVDIVRHGVEIFGSVGLIVSNSTITECSRTCNTSFRILNFKVKIHVALCAVSSSISSGEDFIIEVIISILFGWCAEDGHRRGDCVSKQTSRCA